MNERERLIDLMRKAESPRELGRLVAALERAAIDSECARIRSESSPSPQGNCTFCGEPLVGRRTAASYETWHRDRPCPRPWPDPSTPDPMRRVRP